MVLRRATEDVTVSGQTIAAGERVMVYLAAANREPGRWADPANFELARERERHLRLRPRRPHLHRRPAGQDGGEGGDDRSGEGRFGSIAPGSEAGQRLPGGLLYGFRSLPVVLG